MQLGIGGHFDLKHLSKQMLFTWMYMLIPLAARCQWNNTPIAFTPQYTPSLKTQLQEPNLRRPTLGLISPYSFLSDTVAKKTHSPKKATIMAIVLPGSGQIYNQKYWKFPLVYAGLGGSVWAIGHFRGEMRVLNDSIAGIFKAGKTPSAQLIADRDQQRSRRDIAILCLAGVYIFQVIDATVDAHFYKFNINENLGVRVSPSPSRTFALQYKF
jgi:hypothetical protein